jgi:hypothetical protein
MQPLSSGDTLAGFSTSKRLSVLLPERSNHCNQRLCAFGGHLKGGSLLNGEILTACILNLLQ